ncbi:MAG: glycerol-3-phosphate acyltransferase [Actinomycetota bacterium]
MSELALWFLLPGALYLLGSIPFSYLIGRLNGVDLRKIGSQNAGAGNLTRSVGVPAGIAGALLDGLKGLVPVLVMKGQGVGPAIVSVSGLAIVVGHNWSIFIRSRSGRGLAPSSGVLVGVDPSLIFWPGGWAVAGWKFGGGLCGFLGWASLPVVASIVQRSPAAVLAAFGLSMLMIIRRVQGNPGDPRGIRAAFHRAIFDTDGVPSLAGSEESVRD